MTVGLLDRPVDVRPVDVQRAPNLDDLGPPGRLARFVTLLFVGAPLVGLAVGIWLFWGRGLGLRDLALAIAMYFLTGFGITIGFHRLLTHKAFVARRPLKITLIALGSMGYEGGPIEWVANHRRHHAFTDREGDPHSPHVGTGHGLLKGLWHAHLGWLFTANATSSRRYARDLWRDRDVVAVNRLFPLWCVISLALPFGLGWALGGTLAAAFSAFIWAGLVRVFVLHHVTWSINSVCHQFGRRSFTTDDRSSNVHLLAIVSMGESWHNGHHAFPRSARHGLLPTQWDPAARVISWFEGAGWASEVQLPSPDAIRARRVDAPS